jgi:hypothetical protein
MKTDFNPNDLIYLRLTPGWMDMLREYANLPGNADLLENCEKWVENGMLALPGIVRERYWGGWEGHYAVEIPALGEEFIDVERADLEERYEAGTLPRSN